MSDPRPWGLLFWQGFAGMMATFGFEICNFIQDFTCCTIRCIAPVSQLFKNIGNNWCSNFALRKSVILLVWGSKDSASLTWRCHFGNIKISFLQVWLWFLKQRTGYTSPWISAEIANWKLWLKLVRTGKCPFCVSAILFAFCYAVGWF